MTTTLLDPRLALWRQRKVTTEKLATLRMYRASMCGCSRCNDSDRIEELDALIHRARLGTCAVQPASRGWFGAVARVQGAGLGVSSSWRLLVEHCEHAIGVAFDGDVNLDDLDVLGIETVRRSPDLDHRLSERLFWVGRGVVLHDDDHALAHGAP